MKNWRTKRALDRSKLYRANIAFGGAEKRMAAMYGKGKNDGEISTEAARRFFDEGWHDALCGRVENLTFREFEFAKAYDCGWSIANVGLGLKGLRRLPAFHKFVPRKK